MRVALFIGDEFVPVGYSAYHLEMKEEDWEKVKATYMGDKETIHSVTVEGLYRCVCMNGEGVTSEIILKVRTWIGRRFFAVKPPNAEHLMMYTPSSQLRERWRHDDTRKLVLYVPSKAMVRITTPALALAMPVKLIKKEVDEGQFVMWIDSDGYSCGGGDGSRRENSGPMSAAR